MVKLILENKITFDKVVSTIDMMPILTKAARTLGPKGLMPNLKSGTLNANILEALKNVGNSVSYNMDKNTSAIHVAVARIELRKENNEKSSRLLMENLNFVVDSFAQMSKGTKKGI